MSNNDKEEVAKTIGTLKEKSLHSALKERYADPGDKQEEEVDGFVIDIVKPDSLIEIQLRSFSKIKRKLNTLCENHKVRLVFPIAREKWIVRVDNKNVEMGRRKSPKRGRFEDMFKELVYMPKIASNPNFSFEVILIQLEEIWRDDGKGSWRRKGWSVADQKLIKVFDRIVFRSLSDYTALLPDSLGDKFSNQELAAAAKLNRRIAGNMTYCLRKMGALEKVGTRGNAYLFSVTR